MFTIPLYSVLIVYMLFLLIFAIFAFINIIHIIETGTLTIVSVFITTLVISLTFLILYFTWYLTQGTDWQQTITIFNTDWITKIFSLKAPVTNF